MRSGMSYQAAAKKYGIKAHSTICGWVKKYGGIPSSGKKMKPKTSDQACELEIKPSKERELELALANMSVKVYCLETMLEEASKHYKEDLKKKFTRS
jgi:transposase